MYFLVHVALLSLFIFKMYQLSFRPLNHKDRNVVTSEYLACPKSIMPPKWLHNYPHFPRHLYWEEIPLTTPLAFIQHISCHNTAFWRLQAFNFNVNMKFSILSLLPISRTAIFFYPQINSRLLYSSPTPCIISVIFLIYDH